MDWRKISRLEGHAVRLAPSSSPGPINYGILSSVSNQGLTIDLLDTVDKQSGRYRLEILDAEALIRFFSSGETDWVHPWRMNFDLPDTFDTVQRRQFPRTNVALPIWLRPVKDHEDPAVLLDDADTPPDPPHGQTHDVSSGGVAVITSIFFTPGQTVMLSIDIGRNCYIVGILSEVIRCGIGPSGTWLIALRFVDPSPATQAAIGQIVIAMLQVASGRQAYGKIINR